MSATCYVAKAFPDRRQQQPQCSKCPCKLFLTVQDTATHTLLPLAAKYVLHSLAYFVLLPGDTHPSALYILCDLASLRLRGPLLAIAAYDLHLV